MSIQGAPGQAVVRWTGTGGPSFFFPDASSNISFEGVTIEGDGGYGGGLNLNWPTNIRIVYNTFSNISGDDSTIWTAIKITDTHQSHIDHNRFVDTRGTAHGGNSGIALFDSTDVTVDGNDFTDIYEPIHVYAYVQGSESNIDVSHNTIRNWRRWALEFQCSGAGLNVSYNYVDGVVPALWSDFGDPTDCGDSPDDPCMLGHSAISIASWDMSNISVDHNVVLGTVGSGDVIQVDGFWARDTGTMNYDSTFFEASSTSMVVHDNFADNFGVRAISIDNLWSVGNDVYCNMTNGVWQDGGAQDDYFPSSDDSVTYPDCAGLPVPSWAGNGGDAGAGGSVQGSP